MMKNETWKFIYSHRSFMKVGQEPLSQGFQDAGSTAYIAFQCTQL